LKKISQEEVNKNINEICLKKDFTLLKPFNYINVDTKIYLKCNKDKHEWCNSYKNLFNKQQGCRKCYDNNLNGNDKKLTQECAEKNINEICLKNNYILLKPFIYINNKMKIFLKCNKDEHKWSTTYQFLISGGKCAKCQGLLKITQKEAENTIYKKCIKMNYILYENFIYENNSTKITLKCNKDKHIWTTSYVNFINNDTNCPICKNIKLENKIKELLENNNIKFIRQYRNKNILGLQSLDFYLSDYNIAIECQGMQHFKPLKFFGGEKAYNETIIRDKRKYEICQKNNIKLLYFTHENNISKNYFSTIFTDENELIKYLKF
jgi:hypothetical protein